MIATTALSIDLVLPAFSDIRVSFGVSSESNSVTWIITAFFMGLALGQPIFGPLADRFGRRPTAYLGFGIHAVAAIATALAPSLAFMLVARFVWGLGSAGIRVTATAMVRDRYEGADMARAMSFIMSVFLLAPVLAPTIGAAIINVGSWRWTFAAGALIAGVVAIWTMRMPETLDADNRGELRFGPMLEAAKTVFRTRQTLGYTVAQTFAMGGFLSFLASSEMIFSELYDQKDRFPQLFGMVGLTMAAGTLLNARLAARVDIARLVLRALTLYVAFALIMVVVVVSNEGLPPLWLFMLSLLLLVGAQSILIPNFAALALGPVGRIAGTASAITGTLFMGGGAILGSFLDRIIDDTVTPLAVGFLVYGSVALMLAVLTQRTPAKQPQ